MDIILCTIKSSSHAAIQAYASPLMDLLAYLLAQQSQLNVFDSVAFFFCGQKRDYSKAFLLKGNGFFSCISAWKAAIDHADTELIKHD